MTADVYNETQGSQLPELSLSYIGDFYLKDRPKSDVAASSSTQLPNTQVAVVAPPIAPAAPAVSSNACNNVPTVSLSSRSAKPLSAADGCSLKPEDVFKGATSTPR
jgi:hypothetical protein